MFEDPKHEPDNRPSPMRIGIWIAVGGIGAYMLLNGIFGILAGG